MHGAATEPSHGHDATDGDHRPSSPRTEPDGDNLRTPPRGRREEILDGAAAMFAEHGYHGASLRDISAHIGISHSGMLHHFEAKDVLLDGVIDRLEDHAQSALERLDEFRSGHEDLLRALAEVWHPASLPVRLRPDDGAPRPGHEDPDPDRQAHRAP